MTWLSQLKDKLSRKVPSVSAPRRPLLHSGTHPVVPFHLILKEHQSNYFYTRGQEPALAIHEAGTHEQDPERIPATQYLLINRELEETEAWEMVRSVDNYLIQLNFEGVFKVADADLLAKRFATAEHQNANTFISYYLEKVSEGCAEQPSVADYQRAGESLRQYFHRNLETVMAQFGVALIALSITWKVKEKNNAFVAPKGAQRSNDLSRLPVSVSHQSEPSHAQPSAHHAGQAAVLHSENMVAASHYEQEDHEYYYYHKGERHGPILGRVLVEKIQADELAANIVVWRSGMNGWIAANQFFTALM